MKCAVQIYMVLGGFHVYKSVFLGWVVGRFNIAVNGEHNCGVLPEHLIKIFNKPSVFLLEKLHSTYNIIDRYFRHGKYHIKNI